MWRRSNSVFKRILILVHVCIFVCTDTQSAFSPFFSPPLEILTPADWLVWCLCIFCVHVHVEMWVLVWGARMRVCVCVCLCVEQCSVSSLCCNYWPRSVLCSDWLVSLTCHLSLSPSLFLSLSLALSLVADLLVSWLKFCHLFKSDCSYLTSQYILLALSLSSIVSFYVSIFLHHILSIKHIHLIGVRDMNDLSNAQTGTWALSNAFNPQTGSHKALRWVMVEGHTQSRVSVSLGTNLNNSNASPLFTLIVQIDWWLISRILPFFSICIL